MADETLPMIRHRRTDNINSPSVLCSLLLEKALCIKFSNVTSPMFRYAFSFELTSRFTPNITNNV
jgi:hypothetical protein